MSLKRLIQENLVNPVVINRGETHRKLALVTKVTESKNLCAISYIDKDAYERNKDNVPVRIYDPTMLFWFPKEGDIVTIEEMGGDVVITGLPEDAYEISIRAENELSSDILSDNLSCDTEGSYIF